MEWLKDFMGKLIDKWKVITQQKEKAHPRTGFFDFYAGRLILEGLRIAGQSSLYFLAAIYGKDVHTPTIYNSYGGNGPKAKALLDMCSEIDNAVTRDNNGKELEDKINQIRKTYWDKFKEIGGPGIP